jgi:hypothetical protein
MIDPAMKKLFFLLICTLIAQLSQAQGKFFGGNGSGYTCTSLRDTIACAATDGVLNQIGCDSVVANGQTFVTTGTYFQTLTNADGCDSNLVLLITVHQVDASVTATATTITATGVGTYQWLDCDNGMAVVAGATSQSFTPTTTGNFAVAVTNSGCTDTSACTNIIVDGVAADSWAAVQILPNPSQGRVVVSFGQRETTVVLTLCDVWGRQVLRKTLHDAAETVLSWDGAAGIYLLHIAAPDGRSATRRLLSLD